MKGILAILIFLLLTIVSLNCGSNKKMQNSSKREITHFSNLDNEFEIEIEKFQINGHHYKNRDLWVITNNFIFFNNPGIGVKKFIALDTNRHEIKVLVDSIKSLSIRINKNISPKFYDCPDSKPGVSIPVPDIESEYRYIDSGKKFHFRKGFETIRSYNVYVIFQCNQKEFLELVSLFVQIALLSTDDKSTFIRERIHSIKFLDFYPSSCECKEFELGRIFKE